MEWTIPAFAFPAEAGTHLLTQERWKAELALGGWLITYWNKCPALGIEPRQSPISVLTGPDIDQLEASVLTTPPDYQPNEAWYMFIIYTL